MLEDAEKLDFSQIAGGNVKWYRHSGKQLCFLKKLKIRLPDNLSVALLVIYPRETDPHKPVHNCL